MNEVANLWRRVAAPWRLALSVFVCLAMLANCGGVGTGGTGSFASGPITGFGSIIVGGFEIDDSSASVLDDDGVPIVREGNELRLGMTVDVDGGAATSGGNGPQASGIRVRTVTAVLGPVEAVDLGAGTATVLGQTVQVTAATVFDPSLRGGIASLRIGQAVAVFALPDAGSQRYLAMRVEQAQGSRVWRLRGIVSDLDASARSLRIGGALLDYSGAAAPADLADGQLVRATIANPRSGTTLSVLSLEPAAPRPGDSEHTVLEGLVTAQAAPTLFHVNGVAVDASQAQIQPPRAVVAPGDYLVVEASSTEGGVLARNVVVLTRAELEARPYLVAGVVSRVDAVAQTMDVRNVTIDYSGASFVNGSAANLVPGVAVHASGPLSADGTQVRATQVVFD